MRVNSIRFDEDIPHDLVLGKLEAILAHFRASSLAVNVARSPRDFLAASTFFLGRGAVPADGSTAMPLVERHVLMPSFRKVIVRYAGQIVAVASCLERELLPLPLESFLTLGTIDLSGLPPVTRWIEIANAKAQGDEALFLLLFGIFEAVSNADFVNGVAFLFPEEPKEIVALLSEIGLPSAVHRATGSLWVLIPPQPKLMSSVFSSMRLRVEGMYSEGPLAEFMAPETLEALIRFRPSILESLSEPLRKQIAELYPRDPAYRGLFSTKFIDALKRAERYVVRYPARLTWSNGFSVSGFVLDLSTSGVRFRLAQQPTGAPVTIPTDVVPEVSLGLDIDPGQSVEMPAFIVRVSRDGIECGLALDTASAAFHHIVDWIRRSPFSKKTKS